MAATKFDRGVARLKDATGRAPYWYWPPNLEIVPDGPGAFAVNKPLPPAAELTQQLRTKGIFCQGVLNIIRRENRMIVPTNGDPRYDGGTWANQNYFKKFLRPFSRYTKIPPGAVIGRNFRWGSGGQVLDQGHVGVLLSGQNLAEQKSGRLLHSHPAVGGLAVTDLGNSHAGYYYDYWIHPEDWINHSNAPTF